MCKPPTLSYAYIHVCLCHCNLKCAHKLYLHPLSKIHQSLNEIIFFKPYLPLQMRSWGGSCPNATLPLNMFYYFEYCNSTWHMQIDISPQNQCNLKRAGERYGFFCFCFGMIINPYRWSGKRGEGAKSCS